VPIPLPPVSTAPAAAPIAAPVIVFLSRVVKLLQPLKPSINAAEMTVVARLLDFMLTPHLIEMDGIKLQVRLGFTAKSSH
jgi:hypothetical protein